MTSLSVNVNKFALLRNSRGRDYPSVVGMARRAIGAGVQGITVHPRPDERHIRRSDVPELSALVAAHEDVEFNIEGYPTREFLDLVVEVGPDQCTLVPDAPDQLTFGSWLAARSPRRHTGADHRAAQDRGNPRESLPRTRWVTTSIGARAVGTDRIEFYTEPYAEAFGTGAEKIASGSALPTGLRTPRQVGLGSQCGARPEPRQPAPFPDDPPDSGSVDRPRHRRRVLRPRV